GQGTDTIFSQMVAESLGVSAALVEIARPDTGNVPNSGPTVASRTCMVVGGLLSKAAGEMRERLLELDRKGWADDRAFVRLARRRLQKVGPLRIDREHEKPAEIEWDGDTDRGGPHG